VKVHKHFIGNHARISEAITCTPNICISPIRRRDSIIVLNLMTL
jgi:hypothetical protein